MSPSACNELLAALAAPVAVLVVMANANITTATVFMLLLTGAAWNATAAPQTREWIAVAFVAGFLSDLVLNATSARRKGRGARGQRLQDYFRRVGWARAAVFAGLLSVWLVLPALALWTYWNEAIGGNLSQWMLLPVGFAVGATTGVFSQTGRALEPLLPFYQATSGNLENRAWDGASVLVPLLAGMAWLRARE